MKYKMSYRKADRIKTLLLALGLLLVAVGLFFDSMIPFYIGFFTMLAGIAISAIWERCPHCGKWLVMNEGERCRRCGRLLDSPGDEEG